MSASDVQVTPESTAEGTVAEEQRISADSHMGEPPDLWEKRLPAEFKDRALRFPRVKLYETGHHLRAGGWDPDERLKDLALDAISAEVLYPSEAKRAWVTGDPGLEEACVRVYNDWIIDFCRVAPHRFWGLAMISCWNIDHAVSELERCIKAGLHGATIPAAPADEIPYSSDHYEKFWGAAQALGTPLSLHINTGPNWPTPGVRQDKPRSGLLPDSVHTFDCMKALGDLVSSGVLERYPDLKFVVAETGVGWIPFFAQEFDFHMGKNWKLPLTASEYLLRQVYATFVSDRVGGFLLSAYGKDNFMWSNDYPHPNCIWPDSTAFIARDLGRLSREDRASVICLTVARLYNGGELPPPADPPGEHQEIDERWSRRGLSRTPQALERRIRG